MCLDNMYILLFAQNRNIKEWLLTIQLSLPQKSKVVNFLLMVIQVENSNFD